MGDEVSNGPIQNMEWGHLFNGNFILLKGFQRYFCDPTSLIFIIIISTIDFWNELIDFFIINSSVTFV